MPLPVATLEELEKTAADLAAEILALVDDSSSSSLSSWYPTLAAFNADLVLYTDGVEVDLDDKEVKAGTKPAMEYYTQDGGSISTNPMNPPLPLPRRGHILVNITSPAKGTVFTSLAIVPIEYTVESEWIDGPAILYVDGAEHARATKDVPALVLDLSKLADHSLHTLHIRVIPSVTPDGRSTGTTILLKTSPWPVLPPPPQMPVSNSPYLYFYYPRTGTEGQSYIRGQMGDYDTAPGGDYALPSIMRGTANSVIVRCQAMGGARQSLTQPVRLLLDNMPFTDWQIPVGNQASWSLNVLTVAKGSHALTAEVQGIPYLWCESVLIEVDNDHTAVTGPRDVWACPTVEEQTYYAVAPSSGRPFKVRYPGQHPEFVGDPIPLPGRTRIPFATPPASQIDKWAMQTWSQNVVTSVKEGWPRRFYKTRDGHVHTCAIMQYRYWDLLWTAAPLYDGPRGIATLGHAWKVIMNPQLGSCYGISTQGRFWYLHVGGRVQTIAGYRRPTFENHPVTAVSPDEVENVGNWHDGIPHFEEPWGFAWDQRDDPSFFRHFYVEDTFHHCTRLIDLNNLGAPSGTPGVFGKADIWTVCGSKTGEGGYRDGPADQALFYENWDSCFDKVRNCRWITDFENAAIRKHDLTTNMVSTLIKGNNPFVPGDRTLYSRTTVRVSDGRIGYPKDQREPPPVNSLDGPPGVATIVFPQSIALDSEGNLIFTSKFDSDPALPPIGKERQGGKLRKATLTPAGDLVRIDTIWSPAGGFNVRDWCIALSDGTFGNTDSIFLTRWGDSHIFWKTDAGGYAYGGAIGENESDGLWNPGRPEGQTNQTFHVKYPTAVGVAGGQLFVAGTGAEGAYRITKKLPTDPVQDITEHDRYSRGWSLYLSYWGFRHGIWGQDTLEGNGFAQLRQLSDADITDLICVGGWGLDYLPSFTSAQISDLIHFIRWPDI